MAKHSVIYLEKMKNIPGIYVIFNMQTYSLYIGKSNCLRTRAIQHIQNLYYGVDNNSNLQNEFSNNANTYYIGCLKQLNTSNSDDLSHFESLYYSAAKKWIEDTPHQTNPQLYNICTLNDTFLSNELQFAQNDIVNALKRTKKATDKFTYTKVIKEHNIKDFIDPDKLENIRLKSINIEKLYNNQELDFLMFGIAGDYIGTDSSQTIEEILKEKSCDILKNKKCLWATTGPALKIFEEYFSLFKSNYGESKKLYVLFKLTPYKYDYINSLPASYFYEKNGIQYNCTVPQLKDSPKKNFKALLIRNLYTVEEDFNFEQFEQKLYYKFNAPRSTRGKYELQPKGSGQLTLISKISKSYILANVNNNIQNVPREFSLASYLIDELEKTMPPTLDFPFCNTDDHPTYYLLAEVEDYVAIQPCSSKSKSSV